MKQEINATTVPFCKNLMDTEIFNNPSTEIIFDKICIIATQIVWFGQFCSVLGVLFPSQKVWSNKLPRPFQNTAF